MATKPAVAKAPPPDMNDDADTGMDAGAAGQGGDGEDEGGEDEGQQGTVIATIVDLGDGRYCLYHGDEPEQGEGDREDEEAGGEEGGEAPEGEEGAENAAGDEGEGENEPEKQEFDNPGALLKAVLDILNESEAKNGAGENAFEQGYNESKEPTPKK